MATTPVDRRSFLRAGAGFSATVGALSLTGRGLRAQASAAPARRPNRYEENVRFEERRPFAWPGGASLAVWIIPNVEVFVFDSAPGVQQAAGPDVPGFS